MEWCVYTYVFFSDLSEQPVEQTLGGQHLFEARLAVTGQSRQTQHHVHSHGGVYAGHQRHNDFDHVIFVQTLDIQRLGRQFGDILYESRLAFCVVVES